MEISKKVKLLVEKYETCNPFELATALGIHIQYEDLGDILGYYSKLFRIPIIHINELISEKRQYFTCAHELGHAVLHPNQNTSFLKNKTLFLTDRLEVEANKFALDLIFSKDHLNAITIQDAVERYGIPKQFLFKNFYT